MTFQEAQNLKNESAYVIGQILRDYKGRSQECKISKLLIAPKSDILPGLTYWRQNPNSSEDELDREAQNLGNDLTVYVVAETAMGLINYKTLEEHLSQSPL